jgi:hypothetical protein
MNSLNLAQDIKMDIIYRHLNLLPSAQHGTDLKRLTADLNYAFRRLLPSYIGLSNPLHKIIAKLLPLIALFRIHYPEN